MVKTEDKKISLRNFVMSRDLNEIRRLLEDDAFFKPSEIEVALELVEDSVVKGSNSDYNFILAEYEGKTAGYVCYGPILVTDKRYDLYWISVKKELRRKKIGSLLLVNAEKNIKDLGGAAIYIETSSLQIYQQTRQFYIKHGYHEVARIPDYYADGDARVVYMKKLQPVP
ncbi:MAG: GNAT family N-acetyltransferase [Nitrospirae bacterium]|nr:GNAT family N-acetyltransferase [Nitrospirota bacterium]